MLLLPRSEKKLRRLEIANTNPKLARLQLYRLLSHSESRWVTEMSSAGLNADGQPKAGGWGWWCAGAGSDKYDLFAVSTDGAVHSTVCCMEHADGAC
jgi:hypothetical protein